MSYDKIHKQVTVYDGTCVVKVQSRTVYHVECNLIGQIWIFNDDNIYSLVQA